MSFELDTCEVSYIYTYINLKNNNTNRKYKTTIKQLIQNRCSLDTTFVKGVHSLIKVAAGTRKIQC